MKRIVAVIAILALFVPGPARADHWEKYIGPEEPTREFPEAFMDLLPKDRQANAMANAWADPRVGGWGSDECETGHTPRTPVVFVHGNGGSAGHWSLAGAEPLWTDVRAEFIAAGYCPRELWAVSYDGAGSYSTYNDVNALEVFRFIEGVRRYLRVPKVDVVAHSLGVTVVRKAAFYRPSLYKHMRRFVAIAGATQGTTTCRGTAEHGILHVCDEVAPGARWLDELNSIGETPPGPEYLTIYDGTGVADDFYLGPDARSPRLEGACNHEMPYLDHFSLGWSQAAVDVYSEFLISGALPSCDP
ncbi:MAG TPA: alpha/beta fold hydrolase [Actinomycetota bacterium]|nr:alpha/beta fold hydrolase [Actinomycetota bacterium]